MVKETLTVHVATCFVTCWSLLRDISFMFHLLVQLFQFHFLAGAGAEGSGWEAGAGAWAQGLASSFTVGTGYGPPASLTLGPQPKIQLRSQL